MAYRFGPFQLDPRTGTLSGPEGPIPLRKQAFRLAEVLLERAPELLDRDTLLDEVWGRRALSANALTQTISELRHTLEDDAHHPRYIETVHRRGYRVVCAVDRIEPAFGNTTIQAMSHASPAKVSGGFASGRVARAGAMLLAASLVMASAPSSPTDAGTVVNTRKQEDAQWLALAYSPPIDGLPWAVLRMCARLADHTDVEPTPSDWSFPETPGLHATGMWPGSSPTCLPAH